MSCIVYQTDKKTGIKYAYESISYWDKEKKQPRSTRKYLGRVDEETGETIPGILTKYTEYRKEFEAHKSFTKEDHEVEDKGIIVGEELTYMVDNRKNVLKKDH